jgi:hypothetical protein
MNCRLNWEIFAPLAVIRLSLEAHKSENRDHSTGIRAGCKSPKARQPARSKRFDDHKDHNRDQQEGRDLVPGSVKLLAMVILVPGEIAPPTREHAM